MRTVLTKYLAISSIALLMLASCKKDETKVVATNSKAGTFTTSATTLALAKPDSNNMAITFSFTKPNFGYSAGVTNTLEIDTVGDNWASPKSIVFETNVLSKSYTTAAINNLFIGMGLQPGKTTQLQARVVHSLSSVSVPNIYSNVINLSATPYSVVNISYVFVPGAYQGWGPATADSLISLTSNSIYTGVISFKGATDYSFKVTSNKAGAIWYGNLGGVVSSSNSAGNFVFVDKATVDPAIKITSDQIVFDLNKNTIILTPTLWSVVGDASPGGWPANSGYQSDTDMKFNNGTQTWSAVVALKAGGLKFRLNHDWGTSYGSLTTPGVLDTQNNNNIPITVAGNYLVTVDITHLTYTLVKQ
ncbi:MAG: hypothetical protein JWP37_3620 [Mucilaginibacter sp.]|nr:hypothetical protein [Mucilaginibacter sp.]